LEITGHADNDITPHFGAHGIAMTQARHFYDQDTLTFTYMVSDPNSGLAATVDPVLNLDYVSGTLGARSTDEVLRRVRHQGLSLQYILETHIHADHLSSAPHIREQLGGKIVIGTLITTVKETFAKIFAEGDGFHRYGSQFDLMLSDGDAFALGDLKVLGFHAPGHTPACMAYLTEGALFVGDTLFMPDAGTARCDFPGGDALDRFASEE
jgi:glyoxylase-like metal-dependent hydrolase (beta-lactamase superfamily II)